MTTHTTTYKTCDGCGRNELFDKIEIVESQNKYEQPESPTCDICADCAKAKYICWNCRKVHDDDNLCEPIEVIMGRVEPTAEG
jgi:hypothetical protein